MSVRRRVLAGSGARVASPAVLEAPPDVVRQMEDIADAAAPSRLPDAPSTPTSANVLRAAIHVGEAALDAAADLATAAVSGVAAKFGHILSASGRAFRDPELLWYFRRWKSARIADGSLVNNLEAWVTAPGRSGAPQKPTLDVNSPTYLRDVEKWNEDVLDWAVGNGINAPVPGTPLEYARRQRTGKPHVKLEMALGANYGQRLPGRTVRQSGGSQNSSRWPLLANRLWPPGDAAAVTRARTILDTVPGNTNSAIALRSTIDLVMLKTRANFTQADVDDALRIIEQLVARYRNADGALDEAAVRRLMGNKDLTAEDFVDRVVTGINMMKDEADLLGPDLINDLLRVPGIESFIESVVHKSGYEHGYRFEVFLAVRDLFVGVNRSDLWMQVFVNGKMGPDIVKVLRDVTPPRGRIIQAKSYKSLNALLSPSDSGEIKRQILSDLRRIKDDGFRLTGPDGSMIDVDTQIDFKLDFFRLRLTSFEIPGVSMADLRSANPTVAAQARDAFYNAHMRSKVDEINAWLASPEIRVDLGLGPNDPLPNFTLNVELADQVILPEFIQ